MSDSRFDLSGSTPEWLRRLNEAGRSLTSSGVAGSMAVPLDPESLLADAARNTGLEDFGPEDIWREGLEVLTESLEKEARLTLMGRLLCRADIVNALEARLRIEEAYRALPAIAEERIDSPLFVAGLRRSGTTILHELLARDPAHRAPLSWEARSPHPPPEEEARETDPRIEMCENYLQFWNELAPEYRAMREMGAKLPCECIWLTMPTFAVEAWLGRAQVPGFAAWQAEVDQRPVYAYHRKVLRLLQHRSRPARWTLKAPAHLDSLDALLAEYPDARIIMTHRDPLQSMGSAASMFSAIAWMRSDSVDIELIKAGFTGEGLARRLEAAMAARDRASEEQFFDLRYQEMMRDPFGVISRAYRHFGMEFTAATDSRMRDYLEHKPQGRHGAHVYSFNDLGLDLATERARFAAYQERFEVPSEVE